MERESDPKPADDRSATAKGLDLVTRVITGCFVLTLPVIGGYFLDQNWQTGKLFTLLGLLLGMSGASWQLFRFVKDSSDST